MNKLSMPCSKLSFDTHVDQAAEDVMKLRQFAATGDPAALRGFDISWSSHAGFPCSKGVSNLLSCHSMSQILTGILAGDEASLETSMVFLVFRRSKMQRLQEPKLVKDEFESMAVQTTKPLACRIGSYGNLVMHAVNKLFHKMIDTALARNINRYIDYTPDQYWPGAMARAWRYFDKIGIAKHDKLDEFDQSSRWDEEQLLAAELWFDSLG